MMFESLDEAVIYMKLVAILGMGEEMLYPIYTFELEDEE